MSDTAGKHKGTKSQGEGLSKKIAVTHRHIWAVTANIYIWTVMQVDGENGDSV